MKELPLMEAFYTIQGEGAHSGEAAYFIRLGGCDVGCVWCDVKESWDAERWPKVSVEKIVSDASQFPCRLAVVTGGEPAMYDLTELCNELHKAGFRIHIETSGAHPLMGDFDWITFSPKKFKAPVEGFASCADELKVIVFNKSDFEWAETFSEDVSSTCKRYLQPEWDRRERVLPQIIEYVKAHPEWQISLQTHKYLGIP